MLKHHSKITIGDQQCFVLQAKRYRADRQSGVPASIRIHRHGRRGPAGVWLLETSGGERPRSPCKSAPRRKAIPLKVIADAILYPRDQAAIVPKVVAPVKKFYVDRGSHVNAGQLLAELENQDLAGAHQKSQGGYQQAEVTYQMEVQKVAQDLKLAKQTLDAAQKLYDSRQALYKQGAVSAKDVEDAGIALTQAKNQYDLTQKQVDLKVAEAQLQRRQGRHGER